MGKYKIQDVFGFSYDKYCDGNHFQSDVQRKSAKAIRTCKSGALGCNISRCEDCGHTKLIFKLQGYQKFKSRFTGMTMAELIEAVWKVTIHVCKICGCMHMNPVGRTHVPIP